MHPTSNGEITVTTCRAHYRWCCLVPQGGRSRHCHHHLGAMQSSALPHTLAWIDHCPC
jgi:hypothetical protein